MADVVHPNLIYFPYLREVNSNSNAVRTVCDFGHSATEADAKFTCGNLLPTQVFPKCISIKIIAFHPLKLTEQH